MSLNPRLVSDPDCRQAATVPATDFGQAAADYAAFRQGFPPEFFRRLDALGVGVAGQRVLDLGTGTGLLARALAARGCAVTGVDPSPGMLAEARRSSSAIVWIEASAERTGLPDASFDVVSAATCWHWFDRAAAAREAARLLAPGGALLIAHQDWQRLPGNVVDVSVGVIRAHAGRGDRSSGADLTFRYPDWLADLVGAGFRRWEAFGFSAALSYTHAAWIGRLNASAWVLGMPASRQAAIGAALASALHERFPADPVPVDHSIFAVVAYL